MGRRGRQHQRERKVPHDLGLEQQDARVAMPGRTLVLGINETASAKEGGRS
jgi:hypothetical protein